MKIPAPCRHQGSAMLLMLGLIALLLAVVAANNSSGHGLQRELNHLNQKQTDHWKRLSTSPAPVHHAAVAP